MLKEGIGDLKKSAREWARDLNGIEAVVNTPNPLEEFPRARGKNEIGIVIRITTHETLRITFGWNALFSSISKLIQLIIFKFNVTSKILK